MTSAQPYRKGSLTGQRFDVIVIGSGIGGLSSAALLSKAGWKVLVLERHFVAGGFTHTFRRKDFEWDVGLHYIGEVHRKRSLPRRVFDEITDGSLEWSRMPEVYERIFFPDRIYEFSAGLQNFKSRLVEYFPREEAAIDRYICLVNEARNAAPAFFTEKSMPPWLGRLAWRFMGTEFMKYATSTTREVISGLTSNPKFLGVLTAQYGDYGLPPGQSSFAIHALLVRHYMDGGGYPVGGASSIFRAICPVIERGGGMVMINAEVEKILIGSKRAIGVRLRNGDEIRARAVISDAGVVNTFGSLVGAEIRRSLGLDIMLDQVRPAVSHNCLYVGLDSSAQALDLKPSNCWIYPEYDHDENVRRFLADESAPMPVTYISFPSAKDPDWNRRHPGKSTIEVLSYAPHE